MLTKQQIIGFLRSLNAHLVRVNRTPISETEITNYAEELVLFGYTEQQARNAQQFILFGQSGHNWKMEASYFYPTPCDLAQFTSTLISRIEHNSMIDTMKKEFRLDIAQEKEQYSKLLCKYTDACREIARLKREPRNPLEKMDDCTALLTKQQQEIFDLKATILNLQTTLKKQRYEETV